MRGISSIDVVAEEVRSERGAQLRHFDAVETKAGVVLGFAGRSPGYRRNRPDHSP